MTVQFSLVKFWSPSLGLLRYELWLLLLMLQCLLRNLLDEICRLIVTLRGRLLEILLLSVWIDVLFGLLKFCFLRSLIIVKWRSSLIFIRHRLIFNNRFLFFLWFKWIPSWWHLSWLKTFHYSSGFVYTIFTTTLPLVRKLTK